MPLTFAHPAAAVPLTKVLGRKGVLSALVIGSIVPDIGYLLFLPLPRGWTHSLPGLLGFCLPVGALVYVLFHHALKQPLLELLPSAWQARLRPLAHPAPGASRAPWSAVAVSLVAGAATHLAWDAFTHRPGAGLQAFPILDTLWFTVSGYPVFYFKAIQHVSTVVGLLLLARWFARWLERTPPVRAPRPWLPPAGRAAVLTTVVIVATAVALTAASPRFPKRMTLRRFQPYVVTGFIASLGAANAILLLYCATWHGMRVLRRPDGEAVGEQGRAER